MERYRKIFKENISRKDAMKDDMNGLKKIQVYIGDEHGIKYLFGINSGFAYTEIKDKSDALEFIHENPKFSLS